MQDVCSDGTDEEDEHAGKPEAPAEDENAAEDNKVCLHDTVNMRGNATKLGEQKKSLQLGVDLPSFICHISLAKLLVFC